MQASPLFIYCSPREREAIACVAREVDVTTSDIIVREGETASEFFVIVDGVVKVTREGATVTTLFSGDSFGETTLWEPDAPRDVTVTAVCTSHLLAFNAKALLSTATARPSMYEALLRATRSIGARG
jgi:CRP-like cAMP-binding protein